MSEFRWIAAVCAAPALLYTGSVAAISPAPGTLETYRDWTIGCDNGGRCEAASLLPEDDYDLDTATALHIVRDGGPAGMPRMWLRFQQMVKGSLHLMVDGVSIGRIIAKDDAPELTGPTVFPAIMALAKGKRLTITSNDKTIGHISLSGIAAALRYMDARQGRAGTVTALVATGKLPASAVRSPAALPVLQRVAVPQVKFGTNLWREEMTRALSLSGCTAEQNPLIEIEIHPLNKTQALVLIPCGSGAYNYSSVPLIATGAPGRRTFTLARFDLKPGWGEDGPQPILINASWEEKTSALHNFSKGRGLGDCGSAQSYIWDGAMFRLSTASYMGECRGTWDWITTWRTTTVLRK